MRSLRRILIKVEGLPPAKQVSPLLAPSHPHRQRVVALLRAARDAAPAGFRPFEGTVSLTLTLFAPTELPPGDPTNFLGGVADVLQQRSEAWGLGDLVGVAMYRNDAQLRHVEFRQQIGDRLRYELDLRELDATALRVPGPQTRRTSRTAAPDFVIDLRALTQVDDRALEFINVLECLRTDIRVTDYASLVAWCRASEIIGPDVATEFLRTAVSKPGMARSAFRRARGLSSALRKIFLDKHDGHALTEVTTWADTCARVRMIVPDGDGMLRTLVAPRPDALESIVCLIVDSALHLLESSTRSRVRTCPADDCGRLFLDKTKNGSRMWCSMSTCGNRAKVRTWRSRHAQVQESAVGYRFT